MATHCSILAWRIPWTEEPGWLQSMGSLMTEQLTGSLFTGGGECRGHAHYSACLPDTVLFLTFQKWQLGFFGHSIAFVHNLPQLRMHTVIFRSISFFCILLLESFAHVQALQHCSKGSQVPAYLKSIWAKTNATISCTTCPDQFLIVNDSSVLGICCVWPGSRVTPSAENLSPEPLPTLCIIFLKEYCWFDKWNMMAHANFSFFSCWFWPVCLILNDLTPVHFIGRNSEDMMGWFVSLNC